MLYQFCFGTAANRELLLLLLQSSYTAHCLIEIHSEHLYITQPLCKLEFDPVPTKHTHTHLCSVQLCALLHQQLSTETLHKTRF